MSHTLASGCRSLPKENKMSAKTANRNYTDMTEGNIARAILLFAVPMMLGGLCGAYFATKASVNFAADLRADAFRKIQSFSFSNIDRFSTSSLVTRLTTDVNNVQMAFMMLIRIAIRAPLLLIFSIVMAYVMGGALATSFVVLIPFLAFGLILIAKKAMPTFRAVFRKYDKLNESIEENVRGMRVVKGFSREEYETERFNDACEDIRKKYDCVDYARMIVSWTDKDKKVHEIFVSKIYMCEFMI